MTGEKLLEARLTPRGYGALVFAAGAIAASIIAMPEYAASIAYAAMGLTVFLIFYYSLFTAKLASASRLRVRRVISGERREGGVLTVKIELINEGYAAIGIVDARDEVPGSLSVIGSYQYSTFVPPRGSGWVSYRVKARAGRHRWGRVFLSVSDVLGFFRAELGFFPVEGVGEIVVPASVYQTVIRGLLRASSEASASHAASPGLGTVFLELRDYQPDDDSRLIDWKASARLGRLVVKLFEQERASRVLLVFDASPTSLRGLPGYTWGEEGARIAATLARGLSLLGARVGVVALSTGGRLFFPGWDSGGRAPVVVAEALEYGSTASLEERLRRAMGFIRSRVKGFDSVILVSDLGWGSSVYERFLRLLYTASRGRLLVVVPHPSPPFSIGRSIQRRYIVDSARLWVEATRLARRTGVRVVSSSRLVSGSPGVYHSILPY